MSKRSKAVADYVSALSIELAKIAHHNGLDTTAYMLEIAAAEAASRNAAGRHGGPVTTPTRATAA
jgi:hypothetical protein